MIDDPEKQWKSPEQKGTFNLLEKGYAIIPNTVLFDLNISSSAKVVFCYISSLCAAKGYCWASNAAIAEKFDLSESQVSRLISSLEAFLEIEDGSDQRRKIRLRKNAEGVTQKAQATLRKKRKHNSTSNITSSNISPNGNAEHQVGAVYELYLKQFKMPDYSGDGSSFQSHLNKAKLRYKLTPKRLAAIRKRLEDAGFNMLCAAIVGFSRDDFYTGGGNRGWTADLAEYICRSYEIVEKGANLYERQRAGNANGGDDWAKLNES